MRLLGRPYQRTLSHPSWQGSATMEDGNELFLEYRQDTIRQMFSARV
jgi:hypothetical protein